jgi:mono/diheme cytochrome c family protein
MTPRGAWLMAATIAGGLAAGAAGGSAMAQPATPAAFTAAQADQGRDVYATRCAVCHGRRLDDGEFGPSLKSARFARRWGALPPAALYAYVSRAMPPGQVGTLAPEDYDAVMAYIYQANGAAPGDKPLAAEPPTDQ